VETPIYLEQDSCSSGNMTYHTRIREPCVCDLTLCTTNILCASSGQNPSAQCCNLDDDIVNPCCYESIKCYKNIFLHFTLHHCEDPFLIFAQFHRPHILIAVPLGSVNEENM
jgi:hypothetical protein